MSDRLLKESDVLRAVDKRIEELSKSPVFVRKNGHIDVLGIKKYILTIPSADRPQGWIPCNKRLPKEKDAGILKKLGTEKRSEYVLATVEVKGERMTVTACTYDGVWQWDKKYAFPDFKVVAWMPLPEPWKGADDE